MLFWAALFSSSHQLSSGLQFLRWSRLPSGVHGYLTIGFSKHICAVDFFFKGIKTNACNWLFSFKLHRRFHIKFRKLVLILSAPYSPSRLTPTENSGAEKSNRQVETPARMVFCTSSSANRHSQNSVSKYICNMVSQNKPFIFEVFIQTSSNRREKPFWID